MMSENLIATIKSVFRGLYDRELLEEIASVSQFTEVDKGTEIMSPGAYIKMVPMLISGSISVYRAGEDGGELLLYRIKPGEICAMSLTCCMRNEKSQIRAVADTNIQLLQVPVNYIDKWNKNYDTWRNLTIESYRRRFEELLETINNIAFRSLDERLIRYLKAALVKADNDTLNITHQAIANELNSTREVISRLLKQLENRSLIELSRNKIKIIAPL